jgi:hypothetical protein
VFCSAAVCTANGVDQQLVFEGVELRVNHVAYLTSLSQAALASWSFAAQPARSVELCRASSTWRAALTGRQTT